MAGLLGVAKAGWACCRPHTRGHRRRNGSARMAEKHVTQKWLDEYESRTPVSCPWCEGSDDPRLHDCHLQEVS